MIYNVVPKLGKILKERDMTQVQLSEMTGIPQGTISKFDRNKQHQDTHLVAISRALDITIEDLFDIEVSDRGMQRTPQRQLNQRKPYRDEPYHIDINLVAEEEEKYNKD